MKISFRMQAVAMLVAFGVASFAPTLSDAGGPPVNPLDLTGTWTGSLSCKGITETGEKAKLEFSGDIGITSVGAAFAADTTAFLLDLPRGGGLTPGVCGEAFAQIGRTDRGQATMAPIDDTGGIVGGIFDVFSAHFKSARAGQPNGSGISGSLKGTANTLPHTGLALTCKWRLARTSQADPGVNVSTCFGFL